VLGYSSDLSEGGMMVETVEPVDAGTKVGVAFKLAGRDEELRTVAEVVRVTLLRSQGMFGVALRFGEDDAALRAAIRSFVEQEVAR